MPKKKPAKIDTWNTKTQKLHQVLRARDPSYKWTLPEFRAWLISHSYDQDGTGRWVCAYCFATLTYRAVSIDHVVPLKRKDLEPDPGTNLQVTCKDCNLIKRDQSHCEMVEIMLVLHKFSETGEKLLRQRLRQRPIQQFFRSMARARDASRALDQVK